MLKIPSLADSFVSMTAGFDPSTGEANNVSPPFYDFYYYLFTGCVANAEIGELQINYTYEYVPTLETMPIAPTDLAEPGALTTACINTLFKEHGPDLQNIDLPRARKLM